MLAFVLVGSGHSKCGHSNCIILIFCVYTVKTSYCLFEVIVYVEDAKSLTSMCIFNVFQLLEEMASSSSSYLCYPRSISWKLVRSSSSGMRCTGIKSNYIIIGDSCTLYLLRRIRETKQKLLVILTFRDPTPSSCQNSICLNFFGMFSTFPKNPNNLCFVLQTNLFPLTEQQSQYIH